MLALLIATPAVAAAAEVLRESREVSGFSGVVFAGSGDILITQGDTESLVIEAEQKLLDVITTRVRSGVLYIGRKKGSYVRASRSPRFELTVSTLESLSISGSGDAFADELEVDEFKLTISGSGDVMIGALEGDTLQVSVTGSGELGIEELVADSLEATISGSGEVAAGGEVEDLRVSISGSGDFAAADLRSANVETTVVGSGSVHVWATETLDASVTGSGDVYYRGSPRTSSRITGSGEVEHREH